MTAATSTQKQSTAAPIPSSQRPIPLQGRRDLIAEAMEFQGVTWWVVKDPVALQYYRLPAEQHCVLGLLDGERSLKEIRDELARQFPAVSLQLADVQRIITGLHEQGLVYNQRPGQSGQIISKHRDIWRRQVRQSLVNLLSIRLPGWNPDATLTWLHRWLGWIYHPLTGVLAAVLVLSAWTLLLVQFGEFQSRLPEFRQFFGWRNLIWLWVTLGVTKIIHEFGHGLTCKHFGGECHEMGVMLLVFSPTLYCDVTDSWMLRNKWRRIAIAAGGMAIEIVLSAIAIFVWWFSKPGLLNHLCLNVFFVTTITTVIFNANPLMRYDGYYMLSDWLGIPNLREKASQQLRDTLTEVCLGISSPPDPLMPASGRIWFITYAIATTVYGWFVLSAVLLFLYSVLKPYGLQSLGVSLAIMSVCSIAGNAIYNAWKILTTPRSEPMNRFRMTAVVAVMAGLIAAGLWIPLPWYIEAPFLIEPRDAATVMNPLPGQLAFFGVRPGEAVHKGQLLVKLTDEEKEEQLSRLEMALESQLAEVDMLYALELSGEHALASQRVQSIERQIADLRQQLQELTILAPISGQVVAAARVPSPPKTIHRRLLGWSGQISDPANLGCLVATRTPLLSIAPDGRMQAQLYLDQAHRDDIAVDQVIEIKFDHLADHTYRAHVAEIAREHSDEAPGLLLTKLGGGLSSTTDSEGHERLTSVAYQARVILEEDGELLRPGMRGTARFLVERRPAAIWIWRAIRRTVHFRI